MIRGGRCRVFLHIFVGYGLVYLCVLCICLRPCGELWGVFDGVYTGHKLAYVGTRD